MLSSAIPRPCSPPSPSITASPSSPSSLSSPSSPGTNPSGRASLSAPGSPLSPRSPRSPVSRRRERASELQAAALLVNFVVTATHDTCHGRGGRSTPPVWWRRCGATEAQRRARVLRPPSVPQGWAGSAGCLECRAQPNCGRCIECIDMRKYGGQGRRKRMCARRVCAVHTALVTLLELHTSARTFFCPAASARARAALPTVSASPHRQEECLRRAGRYGTAHK